MRLSQLRTLLDDPVFATNPTSISEANNARLKRVAGIPTIQEWMRRLNDLPPFRPFAENLRTQFEFLGQYTEASVVLENDTAVQLQNFAGEFFIFIQNVRRFLHAIVSIGRDDAFAFKLPDSSDFRAAVDDQKTLLTALEQVLLEEPINARIQLVAGEPGSVWLHIAVGSILGVQIVGAIAWSAAVVRKKWVEGDILKAQAAKVEADAGLMTGLAKAAELAAKKTLEIEARKLRADFLGSKEDPEALERMKNTIKTFADLIHRGAEIAPSLMTPETAANVFPDFTKLGTIISKVDQIPENSPAQTKDVQSEQSGKEPMA